MTNDAEQPKGRGSRRRPWRGAGAGEPEPVVPGAPRAQHLDLDTLNAYLDGQLDPDERAVAGAHLATCPDCGRDLAELRATVALLRGLPQYAPRRSFRLGPEYGREPAQDGSWLTRFLPALPALRVATVAVAVLLVAVTVGDLVANRGAPQAAGPAGAPVRSAFKVERAVTEPSQPMPAVPAPSLSEAADQEAAGTETAPRASNTMNEAAEGAAPRVVQAVPTQVTTTAAPAGGYPAGGDAAPAPHSTRPSGWRLTQLALGLILLWLIVSLVGLERLRRRG